MKLPQYLYPNILYDILLTSVSLLWRVYRDEGASRWNNISGGSKGNSPGGPGGPMKIMLQILFGIFPKIIL